MSLIVEDGTGLDNAESYVSEAAADAYHEARGNTSWDDIEDKEALLRRATDYMEQRYALRWRGYRKSDMQLLSWPRVYVERGEVAALMSTSATWYLPDDEVPALVANACAELALRASTVTLSPDLGRVTKREKAGPIEVEYEVGSREATMFRMVDDMLARFLKPATSGAMRNLVRS